MIVVSVEGCVQAGVKVQGLQDQCAKEVGNNCPGEVPSLSRVDSGEWSK